MDKAIILIVEDEAILAMNLQRMITLQGHTVAGPVASGEDAIALLERESVDLVLMDIELAGLLNGIETAEHLSRTLDIPIVFLTGFSHDTLLDQAKIAAPYGYLIKPVPERELAATLEMALHRHRIDRKLKEYQAALEISEAKYRHLFEHSPLGIFRTTLGGQVLAVNAEMTKFFGCDTPEEVCRDFTDLAKQFYVDPHRRREFISQLRANGIVQHFECEIKQRAGCTIWISMSAKLTINDAANGQRDAQIIDGFAMDITERKRASEALRESEQNFRTLSNSGQALIWTSGTDKLCNYFNTIWLAFTGRTLEQEMGKGWMEGVHPEDRQRCLDMYEGAFDRRENLSMVYRLRRYDGAYRWMSDEGCPRYNSKGEFIGYIGHCLDITERKQEEEQRLSLTRRLQLATSSARLGIWDWNVKENTLFWDDRMFELYGIKRDAFHDNVEAWMNGLHPEDKESAIAECQAALNGEKEFDTDFRVVHPDGTVRHISGKGLVLRGADGNAERMLGINYDITAAKHSEEEKRKLESQLLQAQKMEAIGTLAGGIAHDFNNILGAIIGYTEIAVESIPPDSIAAGYLEKVEMASHRAASLVKQILAFSRQANTEDVVLQPDAIIKEAIKILRPSMPSTITIKQQIDTGTKSILADPSQVHQILMNLCTNAYHAMEERGGILEITLKDCELSPEDLKNQEGVSPGSFVVLIIGDSGPGIPAEIRDKIFEPFFTTKGVGKGTGMGLAIVHGIVKRYGGFITCESVLGKGTVFQVYFPAVEQVITVPDKTAENIPSGKERILFIDDEEILVDLGKTVLERLGYEVTTRKSSLDAWSTFQNHPDQFDVVITDQTMPGMTGSDLALKMLQLRPHLPIILCTGFSSILSEEKAKALGIKGFAMKPLVRKEIALLIKKVLDERLAR